MAIMGDLQKPVLQVRVRASERDALCFHWHQDECTITDLDIYQGPNRVRTISFSVQESY